MVKLSVPNLGERWNDPAAGTFGFMISADHYLKEKTDKFTWNDRVRDFQKRKAFSGVELVPDAHRLALMNARLHDMESEIILGDTLTDLGKKLIGFDGVLANPPLEQKKVESSQHEMTSPFRQVINSLIFCNISTVV